MSLVNHIANPVDSRPFRSIGLKLASFATPKIMRRLAISFFGFVVLATTIFAVVKPDYNWDMAPYIAVSLEDRVSDPVELHRQAWAGIHERAPALQWYHLTESNPYNADQWQSPHDFFSQLTMYRVKIGYTEAIRVLDHMVDPVTATIIISSLSAFALGLLMLYWMVRNDFVEGAFLLTPIMLLAGYFDIGLMATPDLFMAVFGIAAVYLIVKDRPWISVPFLFAMFLIRPDGILFIFALLLAALAFGTARLPMLLALALGLLAYGPITHAAGHPGWWPHFYFSNVALQNDMTGFRPAFSVVDYLHGIVRGIKVSLTFNNWPMIMMVLIAGWALLALNGRSPGRCGTMMLVAIVLCFCGKFVTFPLPDDRVYFMLVVAFAAVLLEAWKPRFSLTPARLRKLEAAAR